MPNYKQKFYIRTYDDMIVELDFSDNSGYNKEEFMEDEYTQQLIPSSLKYAYILDRVENPDYQIDMENHLWNLKVPNKFKKPHIDLPFKIKDKTEDNFKMENEFLKIYKFKLLQKECATQDINNSRTFKFFTESVKLNEKDSIKILTTIAEHQEKFILLQIFLLAYNNKWKEVDYQIKSSTFFSQLNRIKLIDKVLTKELVTQMWTNVNYEETGDGDDDDNEDDSLIRKELFELIVRMGVAKYWNTNRVGSIFESYTNICDDLTRFIPNKPFKFKMDHQNNLEIEKCYLVNKIIYKKLFDSQKNPSKSVNMVDVTCMVKVLETMGVTIKACDIQWHWLSSVAISKDDYITGRSKLADQGEFTECLFRLFYQHSEDFLAVIDYELFENVFKVEKKQIVQQLKSKRNMDLSTYIQLFTHLIFKIIMWDKKAVRDSIVEYFNKFKTIIYQGNYFYDEIVSEMDEEDILEESKTNNYIKMQIMNKLFSSKVKDDQQYKTMLQIDSNKINDKNVEQKDEDEDYNESLE